MATGSFIPNKPVQGKARPRKVRRAYLITYGVYIFFTVGVLSVIALFAYAQYLDSQLASIEQQVQEEQQRFDQDMLETLVNFEAKLDQAATVFYQRADAVKVLEALEEVLLTNVSLTSFEYDNATGRVTLVLVPEFQNVNDALYQREIINAHTLFSGSVISNLQTGGGAGSEAETAADAGLVFEYTITTDIDKQALANYTLASTDELTEEINAEFATEIALDNNEEATVDESLEEADVSTDVTN